MATQDMRDYARYSTWFVGAGTILLVMTLFLTLLANRAANRAITTTEEASRNQSRAYVHMKSIRWWEGGDEFHFTCLVENSGQTPCKRFEIGAWMTVHELGESPEKFERVCVEMVGWNALPSKEVFSCIIMPTPIINEKKFPAEIL